jgi:deoxyribodipyrimidine photo-lyase
MDSALMWFRRDLRVEDNAALYQALKTARRVYCAFVFDRTILDPLLALGQTRDRRVEFIHGCLAELAEALRERGGTLLVRHGRAEDEIAALADRLRVDAVFANEDYEPYARERDGRVGAALHTQDRRLLLFKDQVIFEKDEVLTQGGKPFSVFTPYKNAWLRQLRSSHLQPYDFDDCTAALAVPQTGALVDSGLPELEALGFARSNLAQLKIQPGSCAAQAVFEDFLSRIDGYAAQRDFPAVKGVSYLSVHLRFGTISIRALALAAARREAEVGGEGARVWLSELIWREFYQMILWSHPQVVERAFKPEYDRITWNTNETWFAAWCAGRTGYPLVDAAMAQINQTGYMHNRLRMVVASFLTKDLGIDWRRGEAYFAVHLNDFDLAANNGGWQWAASTGCDAQPYFRIFNPVAQSERFDPEGKFIKRYLPQLAGFTAREIHAPWRVSVERQQQAGCVVGRDYPAPIVDHAQARTQTLARYAVVKAP